MTHPNETLTTETIASYLETLHRQKRTPLPMLATPEGCARMAAVIAGEKPESWRDVDQYVTWATHLHYCDQDEAARVGE